MLSDGFEPPWLARQIYSLIHSAALATQHERQSTSKRRLQLVSIQMAINDVSRARDRAFISEASTRLRRGNDFPRRVEYREVVPIRARSRVFLDVETAVFEADPHLAETSEAIF